MKSFVIRGLMAATLAVLVGCASAPPEAPWPEQQVNLADMQSTRPWEAPVPLPAKDLVRDRSRNSTVVLQVEVATDGTVQRVRVAQSSENPLLDDSALQSMRSLRFVPYRENGVALPVTVLAPMSFKFYDRPR